MSTISSTGLLASELTTSTVGTDNFYDYQRNSYTTDDAFNGSNPRSTAMWTSYQAGIVLSACSPDLTVLCKSVVTGYVVGNTPKAL